MKKFILILSISILTPFTLLSQDYSSTIKRLMPKTYTIIAENASSKWQGDYEMQKYYIKQQCNALREYLHLQEMYKSLPDEVYKEINSAAKEKWCKNKDIVNCILYSSNKDEPLSCYDADWEMLVYTIKNQIQAYYSLNSTSDNIMLNPGNHSNSTSELEQNNIGTLIGVVTYVSNFDNNELPDIGASIFSKKTTVDRSEANRFAKFNLANDYYSTLSSLKRKDPQRKKYLEKLKALGFESKDDFVSFDASTFTKLVVMTIDALPDVEKTTADKNGEFYIQLEPGFYDILFRSKNMEWTPGENATELHGKVQVKLIEIKNNETTKIDCKFNK